MTVKRSLVVHLAAPRGFCAGVVRAIATVEAALERFGAPVFVRHAIVHNERVVADLTARGAVFVESLEECSPDRPVILSAHGVPRAVRKDAEEQGLHVIDATCPLVRRVHTRARAAVARGCDVIVIGHRDHQEVTGILGQVPADRITCVQSHAEIDKLTPRDPRALAYVTQTTLSVRETRALLDHLRARFPAIEAPRQEDICYATTNRQASVADLATRCDVVIVAGSPRSSNSRRLRECAESAGSRAFLVADPGEIATCDMGEVQHIGLTAGASAPECLVEDIISEMARYFDIERRESDFPAENVTFSMPALAPHAACRPK